MRVILFLISLLALAACGGGGSVGNTVALATSAMVNMQPMPTSGAVILKAPVLSFNDSGFSVSDGVTRFGRWAVESEIEWEFSLNQGASWTRGVGASFEVTGDGAKMIWVRARDDAGNTSEIVRVNCVLDTMAPAVVTIAPQIDGVTSTLKLSGIEPGAIWEYSLDQQRTWLPGKGVGLGVLGNNLSSIWLRQVDLAGNASAAQSFDLRNQSMVAHEASDIALQPSVLAQGLQTYLIHGVVVRGDADYVRWDIPKGQQLLSVKLVQYVSEDAIAFYALQAGKVFDAGQDVTRMLVYGHMGPGDLGRNVVADLPKSKLGEGAMTLWFQQTGSMPTQYAIEVITAIDSSTTASAVAAKAVDLTDAIAILKMIVGLDVNAGGAPSTAYQAYAADVDGNGKVELSDAISVLKRIVGLETATASWVFFNGTPMVADKLNPGVPASVSAVVGNAPNVSMTAVLRGDVVSSSAYTYQWALTSKPAGSNAAITDTNAVNPSFKADVAGDYVVSMTITDGSNNVSSSSVTLTACNASSNTSSPFSGCISNVGDGNLLIQTTAGSFEAPKQVVTYSYSGIKGFNFAVRYLYPLDIDDDGIDELLVAGFETQPNTPATYKNTKISLLGWRNGNFVDLTSQWLPNGADQVEGVGDIAVGDFNRDGRLDIFLSAYSDMDFNVNAYQLINKGGYFEKSVVENLVGWQHGVAAADINRDGYTDVFSVGYSGSSRVYLGGPGGLTPRYLSSYAGGSGVVLADFLKDGTTTAFIVDHGGDRTLNSVLVRFVDDGAGNITNISYLSTPPGPLLGNSGHNVRVKALDFNADGWMDVLVFTRENWNGARWPVNSRIQFLKNNGGGNFTDVTSDVLVGYATNSNASYVPVFVDLNGDRLIDIFLSESQFGASNSTAMLIQNTGGKFIDTARVQLSAQVSESGGIATVLRGPGRKIYFVFESQSFGGSAALSLSAFSPR